MAATPQSALPFVCEKRAATGSRVMVVTNHPLASAAGAEILLSGGNAVDAAVAALFALTVVEPMMVGLLGGGVTHIRLPSGRHVVIDALSTAPASSRADLYEPTADGLATARTVARRENDLGARAVATPGNLAGWCHALARYGSRPLPAVLGPAIRLAADGFLVTPYLNECTAGKHADIATDATLAALLLPGGAPVKPGSRLVQSDAAATLRAIAEHGPGHLHGGALGVRVAEALQSRGGMLSREDLAAYTPIERDVITASYRGRTIVGPPPPASSGVHIAQMLNILEGFDMGALGVATAETSHLLA